MGAAKNARKARRKARLTTDRRPYLLDDVAVRWVKNNAGALAIDIGDLVVVTRPDPRNRFSAPSPIGSRIDLTIIQAKRIRKESEGVVTPWSDDRGSEPSSPLFDGTLRKLLDLKAAGRSARFFDLPFFSQFPSYVDPVQAENRLKRLVNEGLIPSPRTRRSTGASTLSALDIDRHRLLDLDFNGVENRVMNWMNSSDPKLVKRLDQMKAQMTERMDQSYRSMMLYGSFPMATIRQDELKGNLMFDIETHLGPTFRPEVVRHRMAPPPGTTYLSGKKADMVILDDVEEVRVEDGDTNDQDLPEVGSVSEDRS